MSIFQYYLLSVQQQVCYRIAQNAIERFDSFSADEFNAQEINTVLHAVLTDHPEYFWFEGKWCFRNRNNIPRVYPLYTFEKSEALDISKKLYCIRDSILNSLSPSTPFSKNKAVYDWILDNVKYGISIDEGQTIYSALIQKKALCKGLSKTFQFLLDGTDCFTSLQEGTLDGKVKHVWNITCIDDKYYNVDISLGYRIFDYLFDDELIDDKYRCFLVSDKELERTHTFYNVQRALKCKCEYKGERE